MNISLVGSGYVGLVTGTCLANTGNRVICVDLDRKKTDLINQGKPPIFEKGLEKLLKTCLEKNSITATTDLDSAVRETEITIIAVGTPDLNGRTDLTYIKNAAAGIGKALREKSGYHSVVVKSTVPPGTTDGVVKAELETQSGKTAGLDFGLGMNPEFLREGCAVEDFMNPDRIVVGGSDKKAQDHIKSMYACFPESDIIMTNNSTAEMIKYTSNSLLATLISFSNEIANICSETNGVDAEDVMAAVHLDKRLNPKKASGKRTNPGFLAYLKAGCGFGGSCFPKDVKSLVAYATEKNQDPKILKAVIDVNDKQPARVIKMLEKNFTHLKDIKVSVLGLAFKPGTDDMRESPAIPIVNELARQGAKIIAYDPVAEGNAKAVFSENSVYYASSLEEAVRSDALVVLTCWNEFKKLPDLIRSMENPPQVIDGRRWLNKEDCQRYNGIGLNNGN